VRAGRDEEPREPRVARVLGRALAAGGVDLGAERGPRACVGARHVVSLAPRAAEIDPSVARPAPRGPISTARAEPRSRAAVPTPRGRVGAGRTYATSSPLSTRSTGTGSPTA